MRSARVEALRCSSGCFLGRPPGTIFPSYCPRIQGRLPWPLSKGRNPWRPSNRREVRRWGPRGERIRPWSCSTGETVAASNPAGWWVQGNALSDQASGTRYATQGRRSLQPAAVRLTRCCVGSRSGGNPRPDGRRPPRSGVFSVRKTYLAPRFARCFAMSGDDMSRGASTGQVRRQIVWGLSTLPLPELRL